VPRAVFVGFYPLREHARAHRFPSPLFALRTNNFAESIKNDIDLILVQFRCRTRRFGCVVASEVRFARETIFASRSRLGFTIARSWIMAS
jgi:hypothetical protein